MQKIDLRSDTVTHPTPAMREAMANAVVGDDVYEEDPTVNELEAESARMLGHEAGLFVSSGTQGNLVSLLAHCQRGDEIIVGDKAHIFVYERGGMATLGGIIPHIVPVQEDGTIKLDDIQHAIRGNNIHFPPTRLVTIENTQGTVGGKALSPEYVKSVADLANNHNLKFHIDGARIFNAATAFGVPVKELTKDADSVTFCLSKGLGAPVGSIIVGSEEFIHTARSMRKLVGGGLRQVGVLAAAGLIAIREMSQRLHEDHENAAILADGISDIPDITVKSCDTNFIIFDINEDSRLSPAEFVQKMEEHNIIARMYPGYERRFRYVTHYWITRERVNTIIDVMKTIFS